MKYRTVPTTHRCKSCQRALSLSELPQRMCAGEVCRRVWMIDRPLAIQRKRDELLVENVITWRDDTLSTSVPDADSYRITLLPRNHAVEYDLPVERRLALREHLTRIVGEALAFSDDGRAHGDVADDSVVQLSDNSRFPEKPLPEIAAVMLQGCISCRGYCCRSGGEHAYISARTIVRYHETNVDKSAEAIVDDYMSVLVPRTMNQGCVYQGANGCVLPVDMRSDTCNRFYCPPMRNFMYEHGTDNFPSVFFVPSSDGIFENGVFASPTFVKIVRKQPTELVTEL